MQPWGDIRTSIVPRNFSVLPASVWEVIDQYFHREELERRVDLDEEESMSTDMEATETVRRLQLDSPAAMASLQVAVHEALMLATAARPQEEEEEYYYDSDDLVLDIDEQYPELAERVMQWQAARWDATSIPLWRQPDFGQEQQLLSDKLPDLHETINQARGARAAAQVPVQSVAPMQLPFTSVRDLDHQRQLRHDQTLAKRHPSPLKAEQHKRAKTPPQPDPHDALNGGQTQTTERESRDRGHSRVRGEDRQKKLNRVRACSKSWKRSKSWKCSKSCQRSKSRKRSNSRGRDEAETHSRHEMRKPGVWSSQCRREEPSQSPSNTTKQGGRSAEQSAPRSEMSNFLKVKEEVVKHAQSYIWRHTLAIGCTLAPDHEAVKCLSAFGDQAQKFAAEILATIEWGTQHWKLQESFPVPLVPKWLCMMEYVQMMTPMWGELPLVPPGTHYEDIRVRCPAVWAWMAVLLQFWQDHMTCHLYGGCFHQASDLANTLIRDINVWMPTAHDLGGTMWLHTPPCGSTYGTSSPRNTWKNGKPRSSRQLPSITSSETLKQCTGPASSRSRTTRHVLIVRRQPHRSCCLNNEWLARRGRPAPHPLKWTWVPPTQESPSTPTGSWGIKQSLQVAMHPGRIGCLRRTLAMASRWRRN